VNRFILFKNNKLKFILIILIVFSFIISLAFTIFSKPSYSLNRAIQEEEICYNSNSSDPTQYADCTVSLFGKIAKENGIEKSISMINSIARNTKGMHNFCHTISHSVAKLFYKEYQDRAFTGDYGACSQGYAHGLMQGAADSKDASKLSSAVLQICSNPTVGDKGGCIHGAGHSAYGAGLTLDQLLAICKYVVPKLYLKSDAGMYSRAEKNCIEGWAMQLAIVNPKYFYGKKTLEEVIVPCSRADGFYKFGCQTSFIRQYIANAGNLEDQAVDRVTQYRKYCSSNNFASQEFIMCNMSVGAAVADIYTHYVSAENEAKGLQAGCGSVLEVYCTRGFANNILSRNANDLLFAKELCGYIKSKTESSKCLEAFREEALTYNK
jgi:hypothetical protein